MEADTGSVERVREQIPLEEANSSGAEAGEHSRSLGRIVGLFAELLSPGGVQRAGRHTAAVLATWARQHGFPYVFLSLNDPPGPHRLEVGAQEYLVSGFGRAKARFVLAALRVAGPQPALVVAAHPHLSPIVWAMKARCPRLRALVLTHGIEVWAPMSHLRRRALRHADLVLAPSAYTARHLASQQGIPGQRIHQLPWGVDPQFAVQLDASTNHQPNHHLPPGFPAGRIVPAASRVPGALPSRRGRGR